MIVLDTSVLVDAIIPFNLERHRRSVSIIDLISSKGFSIYAPKLMVIELSAVLVRYKSRDVVRRHVAEITKYINLVDYEELHNEAYTIALETGCRAIDAFFIACAKRTNSILVSNDKVQVINARRAEVESYYMLEDYEKLVKRLEELQA